MQALQQSDRKSNATRDAISAAQRLEREQERFRNALEIKAAHGVRLAAVVESTLAVLKAARAKSLFDDDHKSYREAILNTLESKLAEALR